MNMSFVYIHTVYLPLSNVFHFKERGLCQPFFCVLSCSQQVLAHRGNRVRIAMVRYLCYNWSLLRNLDTKDLSRLSFLYLFLWRRALVLLAFFPRRLNDVIHAQ